MISGSGNYGVSPHTNYKTTRRHDMILHMTNIATAQRVAYCSWGGPRLRVKAWNSFGTTVTSCVFGVAYESSVFLLIAKHLTRAGVCQVGRHFRC